MIDLTDRQFDSLKVICRAEDKIMPSGQHAPMWLCECECGNKVTVLGSNLRNGTTTSCGCKNKRDLVGKQFESLLVIKQVDNYVAPSGTQMRKWLCRCDCGSYIEVIGNSLTSGHTKSCGCLMHRHKVSDEDMIGKVFDRLKVISRADSHKLPSGSVYDMWNCECKCGNKTISFGRKLRKGTTRSCGCLRAEHISVKSRQSYSESWVCEYLDQNGFEYVQQKTYEGLFGVRGGLLSYDFSVKRSDGVYVLIECQGGQHYEPVDFFGGEDQFKRQVEHDLRKRDYAKEHNIPLLEIRCMSISKLDIFKSVEEFLCV